MDEKALSKEVLQWIQERIEQNKFPCGKCKHFESAHIKGLCIACHDVESDDHRESKINCFHSYQKMDNLSLIEWVAENKNHIEK